MGILVQQTAETYRLTENGCTVTVTISEKSIKISPDYDFQFIFDSKKLDQDTITRWATVTKLIAQAVQLINANLHKYRPEFEGKEVQQNGEQPSSKKKNRRA